MIENAGLMPRLTDVMLQETLHGLTTWDRADQTVRQVSVNLAQSELADPQLPDRIRWTLDRFDIPATRLGIEVLEDVVSHNANDVVTGLWPICPKWVARLIWMISEQGKPRSHQSAACPFHA